ncbi:MAG: prolipoprotein diacylglyceryl transferase [Balneolaceae bacterium]|nr:prolipoprotein diacylglyceryl transferase [Balneolaceae bacterium]
MDSQNFITWNADPIIFTIPEISLPFSVSIWGIILSVAVIYFGYKKITPPPVKGKEPASPPALQFWGLIIGALIIGQLPFLFIDSPSFESIGPISPRWYGMMFALAFITGYSLGFKMFMDAGKSQEELDRLLIYVLVATIIGARLGHVFFYEAEFYLRNIHLIPQVWTGGLASHGAAIGIIIAMWLYAKRTAGVTFMWVADRVVPGVAIGGMFIRIGNFFNSEILGMPTDLPWAIIFERIDMLPRHPSMLYEAVLCVIVLAVLGWIYFKYNKKPPEGSLFGAFLVVLFSGRFLIEFTKETLADFLQGSMFDMGQLLSIPFVLFGIWLLWKKVNWKKEGAPLRR